MTVKTQDQKDLELGRAVRLTREAEDLLKSVTKSVGELVPITAARNKLSYEPLQALVAGLWEVDAKLKETATNAVNTNTAENLDIG